MTIDEHDELEKLKFRINGVKRILYCLESSDCFDDDSDMFFVLYNELAEAHEILSQLTANHQLYVDSMNPQVCKKAQKGPVLPI